MEILAKIGKFLAKIGKFFGPLPPPQKRTTPLAGDAPNCKNCEVKSAWKTLKSSLKFKNDPPSKEMLTYLETLEDEYGFEIK